VTDSDPELVHKAQEALGNVAETWLAVEGVIAVEVARRWRDNAPLDEVGIRVTIDRDRTENDVGKGIDFPTTLEGFAVDIVKGGHPTPENE
jgi:hypothetical protein